MSVLLNHTALLVSILKGSMLTRFLLLLSTEAPVASTSSTYFFGKSIALSWYYAFSLYVILSIPYRVRYRPTTILFSSFLYLLSPRRGFESGVQPQSYLMLVYFASSPTFLGAGAFTPRLFFGSPIGS